MGDINFHTWELLSAYVDGELDEIGVAVVERAVKDHPELDQALTALRDQREALHDWADTLAERPLPAGVRAVLDRARSEAFAESESLQEG